MKENQYYQEKQLYFLYMLCSEGARTLISQEGERNGNRKKDKQKEGKRLEENQEKGDYGLGEGKQRYKGKGCLTF